MSERSLASRIWYKTVRLVFRLVGVIVFRVRSSGREYVPDSGGAILLSNHQSHLDPGVVGVCCDRRLNFLARETLFRFKPFGWFIKSLGSIPIDREGSGLGGLRETLKRLKQGEAVVIFPEGTRSPDGEVSSLKPGFSALAKRAKVPLVPVGIDGAFAAWPRTRAFPLPGRIAVVFGPPLEPAAAAEFDDRELVAEIERRIRACHAEARQLLQG